MFSGPPYIITLPLMQEQIVAINNNSGNVMETEKSGHFKLVSSFYYVKLFRKVSPERKV